MRRLGATRDLPRRGPRGAKGKPGVTAQPQDDGSIVLAATDTDAPVPPTAVAIPTPPTEGEWALRCIDGALTWVAVMTVAGP